MRAVPGEPDPLILTLAMDERAFSRFDALRRAHFPPERNVLPAHLTLFHHLPGEDIATIQTTLAETARKQPPIRATATGLRFLGRGVAFTIEAPDLVALRHGLAARWRDRLTPQDAQVFRPHVTVQNKVAPDSARTLLAALQAGFSPFPIGGTGLLLWHYRGGPWELAQAFSFADGPLP